LLEGRDVQNFPKANRACSCPDRAMLANRALSRSGSQ